jgi:predicted nucleic acid-binding protein
VSIFLDTNVLLYSVNLHPADADKTSVAQQLLRRRDVILSLQVLQEFYVQATRPSRPDRLSDRDARDFIDTWQRFEIQKITIAILFEALDIKEKYGFSYWDSAIIAAAVLQGCNTLYTEDLQHGQTIADLTIANPFQ